MSKPSEHERRSSERSGWLLHSADQATIAAITALALAAMLSCWIYQGGLQGRLIDIEQAEPQPVTFQLDINQADWPEWTVLPGVGEALAKRIVAAREAQGKFRDHRDLLNVRGIGPRTLERMRPYLLPMADAAAVAESPPERTSESGQPWVRP